MAIRAIETGYQEVDSCSSKLPSQKGFQAKGSCSVDDLKDLRLRDDFRERDTRETFVWSSVFQSLGQVIR